MVIAAGRLKDEISSWPGISVHPHRFAALEYRFGKAEFGHVHFWGDVDIPFPRPIHDFLLEHELALEHRWVPNSGWTTFRIRGQKDVEHAIWLMRLSWLRYALKTAAEATQLLATEAERLDLSSDLVTMLARFMPAVVATADGLRIPARELSAKYTPR